MHRDDVVEERANGDAIKTPIAIPMISPFMGTIQSMLRGG